MRAILRRTLVFVATLSLGGAALAQSSQNAYADGGQDKQQQTQNQPTSQEQQQAQQQQQGQQQQMSAKQQAQYVQSWANSQDPGSTDEYSSDGFLLISNALDGLTERLEQQPVGGGPAEGQTEEQRQQQQQQQQQIEQALQQIRTQHQQIDSSAGQLDDNQEIMQHPQHFQKGAISVVNILDSLQQAKFDEFSDEVQQVRQSVEQIDVSQPLSAQQDNVQDFFVRTSDVLNQMADQIEQEQGAVGGGPAGDQKNQKEDTQPQNEPQNQQQ